MGEGCVAIGTADGTEDGASLGPRDGKSLFATLGRNVVGFAVDGAELAGLEVAGVIVVGFDVIGGRVVGFGEVGVEIGDDVTTSSVCTVGENVGCGIGVIVPDA